MNVWLCPGVKYLDCSTEGMIESPRFFLTTMGALDDGPIASASRPQVEDEDQTSAAKSTVAKDTTIEISEHGQAEDAPKTYYSKLSIWLVIIYSGLAIGSDG